VYVGECTAAAAAAAKPVKEELVLKPAGDTFKKSIEKAMILTCEIAGAVENTNYNIKWLETNNREITDVTGRSVNAVICFIMTFPCQHSTVTILAVLQNCNSVHSLLLLPKDHHAYHVLLSQPLFSFYRLVQYTHYVHMCEVSRMIYANKSYALYCLSGASIPIVGDKCAKDNFFLGGGGGSLKV